MRDRSGIDGVEVPACTVEGPDDDVPAGPDDDVPACSVEGPDGPDDDVPACSVDGPGNDLPASSLTTTTC